MKFEFTLEEYLEVLEVAFRRGFKEGVIQNASFNGDGITGKEFDKDTTYKDILDEGCANSRKKFLKMFND